MRGRVHPRLLLVEGATERRLLPELLEANGIDWPKHDPQVHIEEFGGFENFWRDQVMLTYLKAPQTEAVGLVFDADEPEDHRWQTVVSRCRSFGVTLPEQPNVDGFIVSSTEPGPRFGVWMMPNNQSRGYLETFLHFLVPAGELWDYADESVEGALGRGAAFSRERERDKAKIHTWLAWQREPGKQLHDAVKHRALEATSPNAANFVSWFRILFAMSPAETTDPTTP